MNQELVRLTSTDGIEMCGLLYTPEQTTQKIVIHIHGLNGNFYENTFLDYISKTYTDKGYAFLTFNNRGKDYISELNKGAESVIIGGSMERFKDCILDIEGAISFVNSKGYNHIILEGHSYGCNKVLYYYNQKKDINIKNIVLLAPCDIPSECTKFLSKEEYEKAKEDATRLVNEGKENELIDFSVMANGKIAAGTFYNDFLPGGENDFLRYREGKQANSGLLNKIDVPVLIVFGDKDECVLTEPIDTVIGYLKNNIKNCNIQIIKGANHSYYNKFNELSEVINNNLD